ncbi:DinB family protein [Deinococcus sp.]|uniref:DinB family protein n=1 Tax=Deinococcus sp. TaxID=47478 RepID=UPI003C7E4F35
MLLDELQRLYLREVATLERELDMYPDDASVWDTLEGMPNAAGTLLLHLAGSLQHFFGAVIGQSGYIRDREAEFRRHGVPRDELRNELAAARQGVILGFRHLSENDLERPFPARFAEVEFSNRLTLLHFLSHLAFHLGQIDYHRRAVTRNRASAQAIDPAALPPSQ